MSTVEQTKRMRLFLSGRSGPWNQCGTARLEYLFSGLDSFNSEDIWALTVVRMRLAIIIIANLLVASRMRPDRLSAMYMHVHSAVSMVVVA